MCGLYGSIGFQPDEARIDIVSHRGPDGRGWRVFDSPKGPVALGHRRLAILDLSDAGLQPMDDASGRYSMVFNGEIYNFSELQVELEARGERFVSRSDSEVLLAAYRVWGRACLDRLRGMFAFLIFDRKTGELFGARDRFGIKPLYYTATPKGVAFGSEIKQLLDLPGGGRTMNLARVHDFLASGISNHTPETMFAGIHQIRAGECFHIRADQSGFEPEIERYYPARAGEVKLSEKEAAEQFRDLLAKSVNLHMRSDVPVGSCLSGGLDSSSIVCLATGGLDGSSDRFNTVSACYEEARVNEKPFIDMVVNHAGTQPHFVYPDPADIFAKAGDLTWHQDEPFGSTSIFAQWCVFEEAKRAGIKVMLDGQGADEQLGGYHGGFGYYINSLVRRGKGLTLLKTLMERRRFHGEGIVPQIGRMVAPYMSRGLAERLRASHRGGAPDTFLNTPLMREHADPRGAQELSSELLDLPPVVDIATLCLTMTFGSNLQMLLHWEDRNSMAHSIEARVPFLDHPLVEFALALGNDHKIVGGDTKRVLRRAMDDVLPEPILNRRDKLGFTTPEQEWFRGPLSGLMRDGVEATLARFPDLLEPAGTRKLCDDMLEGRRQIDFTLWRIVNLGIWGERFGVTQ